MGEDSKESYTLKGTTGAKGEFVRVTSTFRDWIKADGSTDFPPEAGRYHLYVSYACPWANRTLIYRAMKGLEDVISVNVVNHQLFAGGWHFDASDGSTEDEIFGKQRLREVYEASSPGFDGRVTVPVLFDKKTKRIVNNESSEIIRMLDTEFNAFAKHPDVHFRPEELCARIDEANDFIYPSVNNGVYRCGFATTQEAYEEAFVELFAALDKLEEILSKSRYLAGNSITEADIRLFVTLVRFDPVYVCHFKCNQKRIRDYPNLWAYTCDLYQTPGIAPTVNMFHIKNHYFKSHTMINGYGIVPLGPEVDYTLPHGRENM